MKDAVQHDSALKHVSGSATYVDDMPEAEGALHAYLGLSKVACGKITELDLSDVIATSGVVGVITPNDIPGHNDVSPAGKGDDPVFAEQVEFFGQPIFAVIAESRDVARRAAQKAKVTYDERPFVLDVTEAKELVTEPLQLSRGEAGAALSKAPNRLKGRMRIGGQDHFYLEGHIALAIPGEDETVEVYSSTQHPSEVQHMVSHVLGVVINAVTVKVRRMGGGFGGKETQSNLFAAVAALAAKQFDAQVKIRPDRDDDMIATGKRHDFLVDYDVGFDEAGRIEAVDATYAARCGNSADLSGPVTDRALFHADNCYFYPNVLLNSRPLKTNTVSNTAFRGFGGPQGMLACERWIEEIAYKLGRDPLEIRRANFYGPDRDVTPYHQTVTDNIIARIVDELEETSAYQARRTEVLAFNKQGEIQRKGIALTPVKFGISFTATWYNQAGALVHIYRDGSIQLNHGGTEMGQGLNIKVAQIISEEFGVDLEHIRITATSTDKVPNTSATAASSGSDLNGMAAANAARTLKSRLIEFASKEAGKGRPFYYFAYGASVSEVTIDTLTGEYVVDRVDILHDVGNSLNPAIDLGQVEGGFVQGMGWLTTEELVWDGTGRLMTHAPSTYKIPVASDIPRKFNVKLAEWSQNSERTIRRSKAVGEPPRVASVEGSAPREVGAEIIVRDAGLSGSIGGGRLEYNAIAQNSQKRRPKR